jgi:hypothetical protein
MTHRPVLRSSGGPRVTVRLPAAQHDAVVVELRARGHVPDPRVSCRACRALAVLEGRT